MTAIGVRPARVSDVDDITAINVRSWNARFADILPPPALAALNPIEVSTAWSRALLAPPTEQHGIHVAVEGTVLAGFAAIGPSTDPDAEPGDGELSSLDIDPELLGRGHGSRLLSACVERARDAGLRSLSTWCALADEPRRAFLQSTGFVPDTAYRDLVVGWDERDEPITLREVRLVVSTDS